MDHTRRQAYTFHKSHGGGWVGHHAERALHAARMEALLHHAMDIGVVTIAWEDDPYTDISGMDAIDQRAYDAGDIFMLSCTIRHATGQILACCGGISVKSPHDPYCRVMEAELASECVDALTQALNDTVSDIDFM